DRSERNCAEIARQYFQQQTAAPNRDENSAQSTRKGQQQAFRQQLANRARATGAERGADRKLAAPRGAPRHQQIGDIDTGNQQNKSSHGQQRQQGRLLTFHAESDDRINGHGVSGVVLGILLSQRQPDGVHSRSRLFHRHARFQPRKADERIRAAILIAP